MAPQLAPSLHVMHNLEDLISPASRPWAVMPNCLHFGVAGDKEAESDAIVYLATCSGHAQYLQMPADVQSTVGACGDDIPGLYPYQPYGAISTI